MCFSLHETVLNAEKFPEVVVASRTLRTKPMRSRIVITIETIITIETEVLPIVILEVMEGAGTLPVPPASPGTDRRAMYTLHRVPRPPTHPLQVSIRMSIVHVQRHENFTWKHCLIACNLVSIPVKHPKFFKTNAQSCFK